MSFFFLLPVHPCNYIVWCELQHDRKKTSLSSLLDGILYRHSRTGLFWEGVQAEVQWYLGCYKEGPPPAHQQEGSGERMWSVQVGGGFAVSKMVQWPLKNGSTVKGEAVFLKCSKVKHLSFQNVWRRETDFFLMWWCLFFFVFPQFLFFIYNKLFRKATYTHIHTCNEDTDSLA